MRDNGYSSNQERRRRRMQMDDSGWGVDEPSSSSRRGASTQNAASPRHGASAQNAASPRRGASTQNAASPRRSASAQNAASPRRSAASGRSMQYGDDYSTGGRRSASMQNADPRYGASSANAAASRRGASYQDAAGYGSASSNAGSPGGKAKGANPHDDYQRKSKHQKKNKHTFGKILALIQALLSLVVLGIVFIMDVLPLTYLAIVAGILILFWVFAFFSQFTRKSHIPGKIFSLLMCAILGLGSYYLLITQNMLSQITNFTYAVDNMVVVVLNDDPAQTLEDAAGYTFGIQEGFESEKLEHAIEEVNDALGTTIATQNYDSMQAQVQALYDGQVGAIIYNEAFKGTIEEAFPEFSINTRTLKSVEIKTKVELSDNNTSDVDVTEEPFMVYISGNDGTGQVSLSGRSDVNMLVAVNPKSKQILMITTPRDYYVAFPGVTNGEKDKLTHAGNYGMDCLMNTLESVYDCDIDYYVRVNFDSMIKMVDALGGVTVTSEYDFTSIYGYHYVVGENYVNGEEALAFVRERKNLPGGDFQRGRNQQLMLSAMINKAMSPAILTSYAGLIESVGDCLATSMPQGDITALIKMQLDDGGSWNIVSAAASGTTDSQYCYSYSGNPLSVVIPDEASVEAVKVLLDQLYNGETLVQPDTTVPEV